MATLILASGLASNGTQFILYRDIQGIGLSMVFPTAFSSISSTFRLGG